MTFSFYFTITTHLILIIFLSFNNYTVSVSCGPEVDAFAGFGFLCARPRGVDYAAFLECRN